MRRAIGINQFPRISSDCALESNFPQRKETKASMVSIFVQSRLDQTEFSFLAGGAQAASDEISLSEWVSCSQMICRGEARSVMRDSGAQA